MMIYIKILFYNSESIHVHAYEHETFWVSIFSGRIKHTACLFQNLRKLWDMGDWNLMVFDRFRST